MSRGGGAGRGGRRAGPGGAPLPWDTGEDIDTRPSDLFPKYFVPQADAVTALEKRHVRNLLLFRRQVQDSPLYTHKRLAQNDPTQSKRYYGADQANQQYSVKSKATLDPFTAMDTYSQRFVKEERTLPDFSSRPICKNLFPKELQTTIDPKSEAQGNKKLKLSSITNFDSTDTLAARPAEDAQKVLEGLLPLHDEDEAGKAGGDSDEEAAMDSDEQDYVYDDEDAGDYNAEGYFDDGDGDDMGDMDDDEPIM